MSSGLVRSRLLPHLARRRNGCRHLTASVAPTKVPIVSSDAHLNDQSPPPPLPPPSASASPSWGLLKYGALATLTAAVGTSAYATYAYTVDEVEEKANTLRSMTKGPVGDVTSSFQEYTNLVCSTAMKVPIKAIDLYLDLRRTIEDQVREFAEPSSEKLLPDLPPQLHLFTLVLDLNETLIYSDWKRDRGWRTFKRPGVDAFLEHLSKYYEIVVYSDQPSMYREPVIERLDQKGYVSHCLSRDATKYMNGKHFRDLSKLNRDPSRILYISGHALESSLQPENCVPIKPWKLENDDTALLDLIPFLEYVATNSPADIRPVLASYQGRDIPSEFIERVKANQRRMQEQKQHKGFWRR